MKSKFVNLRPMPPKPLYPYMGRFTDTKAQIDHIVMFVKANTGVVVWVNTEVRNSSISIGEFRAVYEENMFVPVHGEVILSSEELGYEIA